MDVKFLIRGVYEKIFIGLDLVEGSFVFFGKGGLMLWGYVVGRCDGVE